MQIRIFLIINSGNNILFERDMVTVLWFLTISRVFFRKRGLLIAVLVVTSLILPLENNFFDSQHDSSLTVRASGYRSSFRPKVFQSSSGRTHLLFTHEIFHGDAIGQEYYHTCELADGSWSNPKKLGDDFRKIFEIKSTEKGIVIYYYNEGITARGICKREFDEQTDKWHDQVLLFGESHVQEYLELSTEESTEFVWWIQALLLEEGSFSLVWSFEFHQELFTHELEEKYIVSKVNNTGSIESQPIIGLKVYSPQNSLLFVHFNDSLALYSPGFTKRAFLLSNGTWSNWQESGFAEIFIIYVDKRIVENRFLLSHGKKVPASQTKERFWGIIDLATDELILKRFSLPHNISTPFATTGYYHIFDLQLTDSTPNTVVFNLAFIANNTLELWQYDYTNDNWTQISSLDYYINSTTPFLPNIGFNNIDFFLKGSDWRVFWDQIVKIGSYEGLVEIFTVTYDLESESWSPVTQVTDTETIHDDRSVGLGQSFMIGLIGLCITFFLIKKRRSKRIKSRAALKTISKGDK